MDIRKSFFNQHRYDYYDCCYDYNTQFKFNLKIIKYASVHSLQAVVQQYDRVAIILYLRLFRERKKEEEEEEERCT